MANKFFSNWFVRNVILIFIFLGVLTFGASFFLKTVTEHGHMQSVPDFTSLTVEQAEIAAVNAHLRVEVVDSVYVDRQQKGTVVRQVPSPGSKVKNGRRIQLTINALQAKQIPMPNLVGYSLRSAKAEILSRGLQIGRLIYVSDMATNNVLRQLYRNMEIEPGKMIPGESKIDLVLGMSSDDNMTNVPNLCGLKYRSAVERIFDSSLNLGNVVFDKDIRTYQDSLNAVVYSQNPEPAMALVLMGNSVSVRLTLDSGKVPVAKELSE